MTDITEQQIKKLADGLPPSAIGLDHEEAVTWLAKALAQRDAQNSELREQIAALTAENVAQRCAFEKVREEMEHHHDSDGLFSYDADGEPMDALLRLCDAQAAIDEALSATKTPATDAAVNEFMAQGVERFAERMRSFIGKPNKNDAAASYSSREAIMFAKQLREGK